MCSLVFGHRPAAYPTFSPFTLSESIDMIRCLRLAAGAIALLAFAGDAAAQCGTSAGYTFGVVQRPRLNPVAGGTFTPGTFYSFTPAADVDPCGAAYSNAAASNRAAYQVRRGPIRRVLARGR